ncbi:MAG: hypothetical protein ACLFUR_01715 [Candidatus Hadarchaeia archaeon]
MDRGQSALEFLLVIALFLTVFSAFIIPSFYNPSSEATGNIEGVASARIACDRIAGAVNSVSTSDNAVNSTWISIPNRWSISIDSEPSLILGVNTTSDRGWENVKGKVAFGPSSGSENINFLDPGQYLVVVEQSTEEDSSVFMNNNDNRISIKLNPSEDGGKWRN